MGGHHLLLLISLCLSIAQQAAAAAHCRQQDKSALLAFRRTLVDNPNASSDCNLYDWKDSVDCCSWEGVQCHGSTGAVLFLDIGNSCSEGTSSSFSPTSSLFNLSSLQFLSLWINLQRSDIPNEISKLSQLQSLILTATNLSGPIPEALGTLTKLNYMDFRDNSFTGNVPLSIAKLRNLQTLIIRNSGLSGAIPFSLVNLPRLQRLVLSENSLTGTVPAALFTHPQLTEIDLSMNKLRGSFPSTVVGRSKLTNIRITDNMLVGKIPAWLFGMPSLNLLYIYNNSLGPLEPFRKPAITSLGDVDLSFNNIGGPLPPSLLQLSSLTRLALEATQLTGVVEWNSFKNMENLTYLILSQNKGLNLQHTKGVAVKLNQFQYLAMRSSGLTKFPSFLSGYPNFQQLYIENNRITGAIFKESGWTQLWSFNGSHNQITSFQYPKNNDRISSFDLSYNLLAGPLPTAPLSLQTLSLSNNQLTGVIQQTIGNISDLESLDLSKNKIGGRIPPSLMDLQNLVFLNLSYNNLVGPIPAGKFPKESYTGNPGLCGPPLTKLC